MKRSREKAFTLLELVAVIAIAALLSSIALPKLSNLLGINLRTGATQMMGYLRNAYEYSVMRHERIRLRFDLAAHTYWIESYEEPKPLPLIDDKTKLDDIFDKFEKMEDPEELSDSDKKELEEHLYKKVSNSELSAQELPRAIRFKGIYTSAEGKTVDSGSPWIEFMPGGFVPKTIVYLMNDRDDVYSVILEPLGGRSRIEKGEVRPDDV